MSTEHDCFSWNTAFKAVDDRKLLQAHVDEYARMAHTCVEKVAKLWNEIGLPRTERQKEFDEVSTAVRNVWSSAVDRAERKKRQRQQDIEDAISEIYRIKEELGDCTQDSHKQGIEGLLKLEMIVGSSLHTRYEAIQELLKDWRSQRSKREQEFLKLQTEINNLKVRFGDIVIAASLRPTKSDISLLNLQKLSEELEDCKAEKLRRERELAALLSKLRSASLPLGENDIEIAAAAHPSLRFYREALPGHFSLVRPSFSNQPGLQRNIRPEDVELDLSDQTFACLEEKILEVSDLRAAREKQTADVAAALKYLWDILQIPEDDLERGMLVRCLEGPTRFHLQSIERCKNEIRQLETTQAKQLWELIDTAKEELQEICVETMLPMPQLRPLLDITDNDDDKRAPVGKISDGLSKLRRMITETRELSAKREPIIVQIQQLEHTREEVAWLAEYELDADRYKGRDLSRKLDRALKAGRMRDKLPEIIKRLKKAICKWEQEERCPFVYQGQDYNVMLENMQVELSMAQSTNGKAIHRRPNTRRAPSRSAFTPPPPVNCQSPQPSLEGNQSASVGGTGDSHIPSVHHRNSVDHKHKEETFPGRVRTAPTEELKHAPDGEQNPTSGRSSWGSGSNLRPPRAGCQRHGDTRISGLQANSPANYQQSPGSLSARSPVNNFNACFNMSTFDEGIESNASSSKKGHHSKNDLLLGSDNQLDLHLRASFFSKDPRGSKLHSPCSDGHQQSSGANGSTPNRSTRSSGSSRISACLENTEGKPC